MLAGNGVARVGAAAALREFARTTGIGVAETFMGKGLLDYEDPHALGTVGLQSRDYALAGFEDADVVITVGYDLVEHAPKNWNPRRDKKIVYIDTVTAEVDEHFMTEVDLVGDIVRHPHAPGRGAARRRRERRAVALAPERHRARRASRRAATTTASRCARRARCGRSARRSGRRTC